MTPVGRQWCGLCHAYSLRGVYIGRKRACPDCIHWKGRVPKDCRCGGTRWIICDCHSKRGNLMDDEPRLLLTTIVIDLYEGGWNDLSLFKAPAFALEDWHRERGKDDIADMFADSSFVISFRDYLWLHADKKHWPEMTRYVRAVGKQLRGRAEG